MKTKWFFVYVGVGVAFAAVSLWVLLSGGRNARAIRTKYKLGGILLMAWAMLSSSTCNGPGPFVTCYEPVVQCYDVAVLEDNVEISVKDKTGSELRSGDVLIIRILRPTASEYICRITTGGESPEVLQEAVFKVSEESPESVEWEWTLRTSYKGEATVAVYSSRTDDEGKQVEQQVGGQGFTLK
jgi:uncharacterized protein YqfB (UPF0267 family)